MFAAPRRCEADDRGESDGRSLQHRFPDFRHPGNPGHPAAAEEIEVGSVQILSPDGRCRGVMGTWCTGLMDTWIQLEMHSVESTKLTVVDR